ncbi:MAG: KamA family radical SAM protein [Sphaerochaetaceae bacterium]|nr:KamA family radical SAM protein [Sphaerochaetaceae bacterium]
MINSIEQLKEKLKLTEEELSWKESPQSLPVLITDYYFSLLDPKDPNDALRRQCVPTSAENREESLESSDPLAEVEHSPSKRFIHRYKNRIALLTTDICAQYCRHCFRRRFTGNFCGPLTEEDLKECCSYLEKHTEVKEILLTGGDVLTLSDSAIYHIVSSLREASPRLVIRICTRMVAVQPQRITDSLISVFKSFPEAPFYLMTQFNHVRELTDEAVKAVGKFIDAGIPAMNQSVLLRGVNDNADDLEELCNALVFNRIKPYYLFQGDLVTGTGTFRVPLERGLEIEKQLRERLSGLAMPLYAADLPDGGGKVPLCGSYIEGKDENGWIFRTLDGQKRIYPDPQI